MIYIVRHGQTDWNLEGRYKGIIDISLNEKGISQAEKLKGIKFNKVISSPLNRATKTAKIMTDEEIETDERIIERSNGELEGTLKKEQTVFVDFNDSNETRLNIESIGNLRKRIKDFFNEITKKYREKKVFLFVYLSPNHYTQSTKKPISFEIDCLSKCLNL